ncbi:MAG TPA: TRAP transporter small permease [Negativicutes bacterium]|nr:TRAP transporter small permease [Negativicutes bacterium]
MKINKLMDGVAVLCMALILLLVVAQVVMRYVFNSPLVWSEELAVYVMVWMTFIGSVICMRDNEHIEVTILVDYLPHSLQRGAFVFSRLVSAIFWVIVAYYGFELVQENRVVTSAANQINMGLVYSILPLCSIGMLFYIIRSVVKGE